MAQIFGELLAHRGPDGQGFLSIDGSGQCRLARSPNELGREDLIGVLVHRRLSIIDLTTGDQPMGMTEAGAWIVFNGEIYNYRELRAHLQSKGIAFRTNSDTEVILAVYRHWGLSGFGRLNGIFAFALYDEDRRELILARDPVGVKPLYWARARHGVAFASEIRPLLAAGYAERVPNPEALAQYLFYRFVPSPRTLWRDVMKVAPGYALRFGQGGRLLQEFDFAAPAPAPAPASDDSRGDIVGSLAHEFASAVQRQMVADVPVGAFLSGGLDSSMVVAAMKLAGASPQTFGIGFTQSPATTDEQVPAALASELLRTQHESVGVQAEPYFARFPEVVVQVEEPLAEAGMLLLSDVSASAARHMKVVLTGQGADEPLGGYPRHQAAHLALVLSRFGSPRRWPLPRNGHEKVGRFLQVLRAPHGFARAAAPFSALSPETCGTLVRGCGADAGRAAILEGVAHWWQRSEGMDDLARILYVDVRTSLADDLLLMGDKTAMAHGLEARVPFLDLEYLRLLESIPGSQRVSLWRRRKWIQHALGRRILPPKLVAALEGSRNPFRKKLAFEVPMDLWLREGFGKRLPEVLGGQASMLPHYVDREYVQRTATGYLGNRRQSYRTVLALYVLELWLRATVAELPTADLPTA